MDLSSLIASLGDDGLILGLLAVSGLGLVVLGFLSAFEGRSDVRRRAAEGVASPRAPGGPGAKRAEAQRSLERLMTHLETTFAGGDAKQNKVLRLKLIQAGFFEQRAVSLFFAARIGLAILLFGAGLIAMPFLLGNTPPTTLWIWSGMLAGFGYLAPTFYLDRRIKARAMQHRSGFPDFMDLMVVCSEAGLSMEAAIDRIARELVEGYPSLAENLYMASLEIRAGKAFTEALEGLGTRLGIEEAQMLATLLQQSAELGTSLSQSLRVYSDEMRNKRMSRAEEKAYALPAKLVVPLTLFVFPVLIVTLMLPVVIKVSERM